MPFIRLTHHKDNTVVDVNINSIITFAVAKGAKFTTVELRDNLTLHVVDAPRSIRGYIKRAEGLLPEKEEVDESNQSAVGMIPGLLAQGS